MTKDTVHKDVDPKKEMLRLCDLMDKCCDIAGPNFKFTKLRVHNIRKDIEDNGNDCG